MFMLKLGNPYFRSLCLPSVPWWVSPGIPSASFGMYQAPFSSGCLSGMEIPLAGSHRSELALLLASEQPFLSPHPNSRPALPSQLPGLIESSSCPWFTLCLSPLEHLFLIGGRFGVSIPRAIPYIQCCFRMVCLYRRQCLYLFLHCLFI